MDINKYDIEIKHHAFKQALKRGISPDLIENTLINGKIKRHGKNYIKVATNTVICVGQIIGNKINIITIERVGGKK